MPGGNNKPWVYIDHENGRVEGQAWARVRTRVIEALYTSFFAGMDRRRSLRLALLHGDTPEDVRRLAVPILKECTLTGLFVLTTGPALGVHTGPKMLALCRDREEE